MLGNDPFRTTIGDFDAPWDDWDDPRYIHALFDYGYTQAVNGQVWHAAPPGISPGLQR